LIHTVSGNKLSIFHWTISIWVALHGLPLIFGGKKNLIMMMVKS